MKINQKPAAPNARAAIGEIVCTYPANTATARN